MFLAILFSVIMGMTAGLIIGYLIGAEGKHHVDRLRKINESWGAGLGDQLAEEKEKSRKFRKRLLKWHQKMLTSLKKESK